MPDTLTDYEYSATKEILHGTGPVEKRVRYRGRCSCGRQTHMAYSTPQVALAAIRMLHNPNTETENHHDDR